eukprot:Gb_32364 [translate_table: standard]
MLKPKPEPLKAKSRAIKLALHMKRFSESRVVHPILSQIKGNKLPRRGGGWKKSIRSMNPNLNPRASKQSACADPPLPGTTLKHLRSKNVSDDDAFLPLPSHANTETQMHCGGDPAVAPCNADNSFIANDECCTGRERLQRYRLQVAGNVWIPDTWSHDERLKEWIDPKALDQSLVPSGLMSARIALVEDCRREPKRVPMHLKAL